MTAHLTPPLSRLVAQRIVERVAAGMKTPVFVTDETGQVIASRDGSQLGVLHTIAAQAIAAGTRVHDHTRQSLAGMPLVHGSHIVGAIVLADIGEQGEELGYLARALAELIIHQMTIIEQLPHAAWAREKFLSDLLHGHLTGTAETVLEEAALLGIDLEQPRVVVLIAIEPAQHEAGSVPQSLLPFIEWQLQHEQSGAELLDLAREALGARHNDLIGFVGASQLVILPVINPDAVEGQLRELTIMLQRFLGLLSQRVGGSGTVGIGRSYDGWQALAQSFADARFALEVGRQLHGPGQVYFPGDLGFIGLVCSNDPVLKAQLARHVLRRIEDDLELISTIEVFFESDLSPSLAASRLHIHRHTLAYRLAKVTRLTGLDLHRFQDLAQLYAALVLRRMNASSTSNETRLPLHPGV